MKTTPNSAVEAAFLAYPPRIRERLYALRELIFETAAATQVAGPITETLKWGEPAYLTEESKTGSTIRLGWKKASPEQYAMYFNCNTTLVQSFRELYPRLKFEGNRAVVFDEADELPTQAASRCIELALTYHLSKRKRARGMLKA